MKYRLKGSSEQYTKEEFVKLLSSKLAATIISPNIDDETIKALGGEVVDDEIEKKHDKSNHDLYRLKLERNQLLAATDWIEKTTVIPKSIRDKYIVWRELLRNIFILCPNITVLPPAPLVTTKQKKTGDEKLTDCQIEIIKNYKTKEESWLQFLEYWQHTGYTDNIYVVKVLIEVYTSENFNEIINGI